MVMQQMETKERLNLQSIHWGGLTWLNIEKPNEQVKEYLAQNYPFHKLDLDDCLSRIQRPKIDEYQDYVFLVLHFPAFNKQARVTESSQVSFFIGNGYLVTLHEGRLKPLVKLFHECQDNDERQQEYFLHGSAYLLYRIVDRLVDYCFPILNKVGDNIEAIEEKIFCGKRQATVREISELRRDIISLRRVMGQMKTTISILELKIRRFSQTDLTVYFGDTVDHLEKMWDAVEEYKEVIEGLNSAYDSLSSERINDILRTLTILTTIGTTLTVIASFFGMNIPLPGGANSGGYIFSWIILLALMLAIIVGMLLYFKRKEWL
ncbi:MAG: magnesium transporter CorA family protein [Dehalococcoidales bacterium]|nr:magnesium transporter CorA family protein [Dehalococcoidales bacterium]